MKKIFVFLLFLFCPSAMFSAVEFSLNPGCDLVECENVDSPALFYAQHSLDNRTIHIVFASFDQLTINIFDTKEKVTPTFNYSALFNKNYSDAIQLGDEKILNSFAVILRRLIQFNDSKDSGQFDKNDSTIVTYELKNLHLNNKTSMNQTNENPNFLYSIPSINGSLSVDIRFPGEQTRDDQFPKLQISNEGFYLNIVFQANEYKDANTRFGLEFYLMNFGIKGFDISSSNYIDDHYTPGIFNVWQLKRRSELYKGSMLWKPVVYLDESRSIEQNTLMKIYSIENNVTLKDTDCGIYRSFYKPPATYVSSFNVSWGQANDGFFAKSNYTFVQFTAALTDLQTDSTQMFVTVALIISLALPVLVGLIALVLFVKRSFSSSTSTMSNYNAID